MTQRPGRRGFVSKVVPLVAASILAAIAGAGIVSAKQPESPSLSDITPIAGPLSLGHFKGDQQGCFDRAARLNLPVVDSHLHPRPFGGRPIHFSDVLDYMRNSGVLFANIYGIGQRLPVDSECTYYLDCPGVPVTPSLKNDFVNAQSLLDEAPLDIHLNVSMTFADLASPEEVLASMHLLDREFPGVFKMMGEVNLIKQALFDSGRPGVEREVIESWAPFMAQLREWNFPITIHSDLGHDGNPTKHLHLMDHVLSLYPENKIIWPHLGGLSKELHRVDPAIHIDVLETLLAEYPNLFIDLSWRILYDQVFSDPEMRDLYVAFINRWPDRFLPGTDFVASEDKSALVYRDELFVNSAVLQWIDDEAFRQIALGQNFFEIYGLDYTAPGICQAG